MSAKRFQRRADHRGTEGGFRCTRSRWLVGMARSTLPYELRQPVKDAPVIAAMKRLSSQYSRYAYRRIRIFLRREALAMSASRAERLWRKAGLQLPRRRPRRRIAVSRPRPLPPRAANHVWAYDFVFDACANGQQIKCLTVVDEFTLECLVIDVAGSIRSRRVIGAETPDLPVCSSRAERTARVRRSSLRLSRLS